METEPTVLGSEENYAAADETEATMEATAAVGAPGEAPVVA